MALQNAFVDLATEPTLATLESKTPDLTGVMTYESATLAAGSLSATGRAIALRVFATVDSTLDINGGDPITVRQDTGFDLGPEAQLINPVVNWLSGSIDVLIVVIA